MSEPQRNEPPRIDLPVAGERMEIVLRRTIEQMNALAEWMHEQARERQKKTD